MLRLRLWSARGESHHPAFVDNWSTIIRTFLALSTHCHSMTSPSRKWERGVSPRLHLVVFVYGESKELIGRGSWRFPTPMEERSSVDLLPVVKKLLGRVTFGIHTLAKSWTVKVASHQPVFMDSCLTIRYYTRLSCLPSRCVSPGCSIKSYWTELHMEFCRTSATAELLFKSVWSVFMWLS